MKFRMKVKYIYKDKIDMLILVYTLKFINLQQCFRFNKALIPNIQILGKSESFLFPLTRILKWKCYKLNGLYPLKC